MLALADGERHGYAVGQDAAVQTDGRLDLGPGTLYGRLKRMLAAAMVEESDVRPDPALEEIAGHASPKTTKLYDRTADTVTVDEIERIVI